MRCQLGGLSHLAALAHVIENKAEAAYRRRDLFEKRRKLMEVWTACCTSTQATILEFKRAQCDIPCVK